RSVSIRVLSRFLFYFPLPPLFCSLSLHDALPIYLLVRSRGAEAIDADHERVVIHILVPAVRATRFDGDDAAAIAEDFVLVVNVLDRKSTRLNSSHVSISYAVFCLKKKKTS